MYFFLFLLAKKQSLSSELAHVQSRESALLNTQSLYVQTVFANCMFMHFRTICQLQTPGSYLYYWIQTATEVVY